MATEATWMGAIPENWGSCPLKHIFEIQKRIAGKEGYTVLSITQSGIKPKNMSAQGQYAQDYSNYQLVYPGDFAMNHMDLLTGWVDISQYEGVTSPDYRVFVNRDTSRFCSEFYKFIFQYCYSNKIFYGMGQGVSGFGRWRLPADMFLNFRLPVPGLEEQSKIASFLDRKICDIDAVITEARASIEEYKAWKASIIHEAVTKGLDPEVETVDSGISWIGQIPKTWAIIAARHMVSVNHGSDPKTEGSVPVYGSGANSFKTCGEYKEGPAVLIGRKGVINIPRYVEGKYWNVDTAFDVKPLDDAISLKFYYYLATCFDYKLYMSQTTLPSMTQASYNSMKLPIPDRRIQDEIVEYLDKRTSDIDELIREKTLLIGDLEAYKKSLIFEVVTGKRKVV